MHATCRWCGHAEREHDRQYGCSECECENFEKERTMNMDHVQLARALWVWFGYRIDESSEPGADPRVDALAEKLEEWIPALPYEPLQSDQIERIALELGWDLDQGRVGGDLDTFARYVEQAHGICITNMAGGGKADRYVSHNKKVGNIGPANLPRLEVDAAHCRRMACGVQEWMAQGSNPDEMPKPQIAALALLVKELCTEYRKPGEDNTSPMQPHSAGLM